MNYKQVGPYKYFESCRFCKSPNVVPVINLGLMPLAGGFIKIKKNQTATENFYPLELNFCKDCFLLQVNISINPDMLFKNYFYFSSSIKTLVDHFENISNSLTKIFKKPNQTFVVEIGCNDGAFIKSLLSNNFKALGVDPAANVVNESIKKGIPIINDYFTEKLAKKIVKRYGKADAIFGFHSMAHIEDMHDVIRGVKQLLKKEGILVMEVHYLGNLIKELQYDMIYHEHQYYYSLLSLRSFFKLHGMEIYDVKTFNVRAGSIMFFIQNDRGQRKISESVKELAQQEIKNGLNKAKTFESFFIKIETRKKQLLSLLKELKQKNYRIIGYGASGRGTIIANYCSLNNYLSYIVDDTKAKHGTLLPGTHHRIFSSSKLDSQQKPDYALLFAWPFLKEVLERNKKFIRRGGKFIIPLPKVKIIP